MTTQEKTRCLFYRDLFGAWRWEARDEEGHICDSRQSYDTREACVDAARRAGVCIEHDNVLPHPAASAVKQKLQRECSILCAYANADFQRFMREALKPYNVVVASSGREALAALHASVFDAFVLDYWLPDWSGLSYCRDIRKIDPHVPVCFYSRARSQDAHKRALRAGADLFLSTPVEPEILRNRVETLIVSRDGNTVRAEAEEQRAIQTELQRRASVAKNAAEHAREAAARAIARTARVKAMRAFVDAGGTRANFERLWPQAYLEVSSSFQIA